jgi:hypothetical protein
MVVGMFLLVWSATSHLGNLAKWDDQNKVRLRENIKVADSDAHMVQGRNCLYIGRGCCYLDVLRWSDHSVFANSRVKAQFIWEAGFFIIWKRCVSLDQLVLWRVSTQTPV